MVPNIHLIKDDGDPLDDLEKYRQLVEKLNYLTVTRLNIVYPIIVVRQFMFVFRVKHWEVL